MEDMSMEKIMSLARLLGQNGDMGDITNAVSAAQKIGAMMNNINSGQNNNKTTEEKPLAVVNKPVSAMADKEKGDMRARQIKAIEAAIPFLDSEYQRGIFLAVKLLEINSFHTESSLTAMERDYIPPNERRLKMVNAVESCLNAEERQQMKSIINAIKAGSVIK